MEENMRYAGRRPMGRLCYWALAVVAGVLSAQLPTFATPVPQNGPASTVVSDTIYLADGSKAQGSLIISWPAFVTASGTAVAAGTVNTTLGANGSLNVALVPNAGATPAGSYYTVVYQLGPGQVKTEFWIVPTTSPANLPAVRTTPGAGGAEQPVSMQYVNAEFATKSYVDQSVANVGSGNFLPTAGGSMTGPITLPGNPAAPMQAATKQYVDTGVASKADLSSGVVPVNELGAGQATAGSCLLGTGTSSGTWGSCGGSGGTGNLSTNPVAAQNIAQPAGTQFSTNNLANIRYVTSSWNWAQTPPDNLGTPGSATIHLSPCPLGLDTASSSNYYSYKVYISGKGTPEAVPVTGGSCVPGTSSGTITVTTAYAHSAGYTVGSASTGIQEAWNDAWVNDISLGVSAQTAPYVKLASNQQYNVYASVYLRGRGGMLDGAGALIACSTRDRCIYIGTTQGHPYVHHQKLYNLSGTSTMSIDGVQVSSVSAASGTYTVATASAHPFVVGDTVDCEYYTQNAAQHWSSPVLTVPNSTTFTVTFGTSSFAASSNTFGFCNVLNAFIENNSDHVLVQDINVFQSNPGGMGYFTYGIVDDNDQQFIIERAANRSSLVLDSSANWPIGAFFYERTDQGNAGIMYIHNTELTGVNCATGGGNGLVITDTVCQGFPTYGVRYFGGLQPATFQNIYQESTGATTNPLYGYPAQNGFVVQGGTGTKILGTFPLNGYTPVFASGGGAAAERSYFVVPRSTTLGYGPMLFAGSAEPTSGSVSIPVVWPSVEFQSSAGQSLGTLTWDVLVTTGTSATPPSGTGSYAIATNISGTCGANGMCKFTDTQAAPASYTVAGQQFSPVFWFWPTNLAINNTTVLAEQAGTSPSAVASQGILGVSIIADQCKSSGVSRQRSPIWVSCLTSENSGSSGMIATVLQEQDTSNGGPTANSKGRLNLGKPIGNLPNDLITLQDSNFGKTMVTAGERPTNDAGDMALGVDQTGGLSERASTSITSYINGVPNGSNYLERLTAAAKTFNVPVTVNGNLSVTGSSVTLPITGSSAQCLHVSSTGVLSGTGADCGSGGGGGGTVNSGITSQLAMYSGNGAAVSGDSALTDNGTVLNYAGTGGLSTTSGAFSGNLTVNGQLLVAGPWMVSSPLSGTAMTASAAGTSSLGISNDGNFYISANGGNPQQVATSATSSYFSNLWQEDANDLGAYNGANPQGLHIYGTYTNSSNYERTGLGWDATDGFFVLKNENAGTGAQRGLGFWIGSGVRWAIDTASTLKPFNNNSFDVGSTTLAPRTMYAATSFDTLTQGRLNFELCNDTTNGTALNLIAVYNTATPACAVKAAVTSTDGAIGIVSNGSGMTGNAVITYRGYVPCSFDGATTAGDFVVASSTTAGDCHDAGAARPASVQVLGRVESTNAAAGTYGVRAALDSPTGGSGIADPGSNGILVRNGANGAVIRSLMPGSANISITNPSGVVGNPILDVSTPNLFSSPALTGTPTAPTAAANTNNTQIANTAFVAGQITPNSTAVPWMPTPHYSTGINFSTGANKAILTGVILTFPKTTTQLTYLVSTTADNSANLYDVGIYSGTSGGACTQVAHTGPTAGTTFSPTASTWKTLSWTGGAVTLQPGRYYLAYTTSCTSSCTTLGGDSAGMTFAGSSGGANSNVSVPSGGTLPATLTCPADGYATTSMPNWAIN
jgi:hypothetical protein